MTWPRGRAPDGTEEVGLGPRLVAEPQPVPVGRGRWRLHLQARQFGPAARSAPIAELTSARSRRLEEKYNAPAVLTFTVSGRSPEAADLAELRSDVVATRWDETSGRDVIVFRGIVAQTEDQISEQEHTVTVTVHSYLKMLERRILTGPWAFTQLEQDQIVAQLVARASAMTTSAGAGFGAGSYLPLAAAPVNPDGSARVAPSGQLRDRAYLGNQKLDEALSNLAAVLNGFDYDVAPYGAGTADAVRVFYPYQGTQRFDMALVYGSSVSALTRTVNSGDYANYWRVLGEGTEEAQLYAEVHNSDAIDVTVTGLGLWQSGDNASDVSSQSTLDEKARGDLAASSILTPSYTVTMRPGAYVWGSPNMGDVVPLVVRSGRLDVVTDVRVVGLTYDIGDDGDEKVDLTVGRPVRTLTQLINAPVADVNALARR